MLIVSILVCVARHAQSTQNNRFATLLLYMKENVKDEFSLSSYYDFSCVWPGMSKIPKICYFFAIS